MNDAKEGRGRRLTRSDLTGKAQTVLGLADPA